MTNLTDKWKKGELPDGWYWCECYNEEIKKLYYDGDCFELDDPETKNYYFFTKKDCAEIEILEKVPSYTEWQAKLEENEKLKELLKRARGLMNCTKDWACTEATKEMITKIDQVLGEE